MILRAADSYSQFVELARELFAGRSSANALEESGFDELLSVDSEEGQQAPYAFLDAQGYHGGETTALSRLVLAEPLRLAGLTDTPDPVLAHPIDLGADSTAYLLLGSSATSQVFVDVVGQGLVSVPTDAVTAHQQTALNDTYASVVELDLDRAVVVLGEPSMGRIRDTFTARLRLGAGAEILGATSRMIEDALRHTGSRKQFGESLASFQPVKEMLAWAAVDWKELNEFLSVEWRRRPLIAPDIGLAETAKALAGTVGLRIAQMTMQATGAIAFTWEYPHARAHRRVLALDSVGGSAAVLTREIGSRLRATGELHRFFELGESWQPVVT